MTDPPAIDRAALRRTLETLLPEGLALLERMVGVNSFTHHADGVNRVNDLAAQWLQAMGFEIDQPQAIDCCDAPQPPLGRHLIARRPGRTDRRIGLVGHLDTVFTEADERDHDFRWRVDGDRIYGPGTFDMKAGNVTAMMTLRAMQAAAPQLFDAVTWRVMFNAAEEGLSSDFAFIQRRELGDAALANLVFEGGSQRQGARQAVIVRRKGKAVLKITVDGRAAHPGGRHAQGASAVRELARLIERTESLTDHDRELTCNVGFIRGGGVLNRVPDRAEAALELRAFDDAILDQAVRDIEAMRGPGSVKAVSDGQPTHVRVTCTQRYASWPDNPNTQALLAEITEAGRELGFAVEGLGRGGLSDGNFTRAWVPTIDGLGPCGANAHCAIRSADGAADQEYLLPATIVPRAMLAALTIERIAAAAAS